MNEIMKRIKQSILYGVRRCICFVEGHVSEKYLTETEKYISTRRCQRCKCALGIPIVKSKIIPPPNSTPKEVKERDVFCENQRQQLRDSCAYEFKYKELDFPVIPKPNRKYKIKAKISRVYPGESNPSLDLEL